MTTEIIIYILAFIGGWSVLRWFLNVFRTDNRSPTDRQMDFMEDLLNEKDLTGFTYVEPKTIGDATRIIDKLIKRPYRNDK